MPHKDSNKIVTIPLLLVIVGILLGHLISNYGTVETLLSSYLIDIWSVRLMVTSSVLLILLFPYYFLQKEEKPITSKEREQLFELVKNSVESQWFLHQKNIFDKQFKEIVSKEASRGFSFPTGQMYGSISDLYVSGVGIFSKFLEEAIVKITIQKNINKLSTHVNELIETMLNQQRSRLIATFNLLIKSYFSNSKSDHMEIIIKSFESKVTTETTLRIKQIQSSIGLNHSP